MALLLAYQMGQLHQLGQFYPDAKPENVLIDYDGHPRLTDFGLGRCPPANQTVIGDPEYTAPEVLLGQPTSRASDWYALGMLLYECMVGVPAFTHPHPPLRNTLILHAPLHFPTHVSREA